MEQQLVQSTENSTVTVTLQKNGDSSDKKINNQVNLSKLTSNDIRGDVSMEIQNTDTPEKFSLRNFVDELELNIFDVNNKLYFRQSCEPISEPFSNPGFDIEVIFDILNETHVPVFKLAKCYSKNNVIHFIIANNVGHATISLTRKGYLIPKYEVTGAGILSFNQVMKLSGGYTLEDPYKELLKIKTGWIPFLVFLLLIPQVYATMGIINLDGSSTGTMIYKKWTNIECQDRCLCLNFIPGLDRKAKYMLFAACLLPLSNYFSQPGRLRLSVYLIFFYLIIFLGIVCIIWGICKFS